MNPVLNANSSFTLPSTLTFHCHAWTSHILPALRLIINHWVGLVCTTFTHEADALLTQSKRNLNRQRKASFIVSESLFQSVVHHYCSKCQASVDSFPWNNYEASCLSATLVNLTFVYSQLQNYIVNMSYTDHVKVIFTSPSVKLGEHYA